MSILQSSDKVYPEHQISRFKISKPILASGPTATQNILLDRHFGWKEDTLPVFRQDARAYMPVTKPRSALPPDKLLLTPNHAFPQSGLLGSDKEVE